jgi:hypothetical protein
MVSGAGPVMFCLWPLTTQPVALSHAHLHSMQPVHDGCDPQAVTVLLVAAHGISGLCGKI